jgi:hypothetical protein
MANREPTWEPGEQRAARQASEGNKAHGSIGCEASETVVHTTDSSVEQRPGVDRRDTRPLLCRGCVERWRQGRTRPAHSGVWAERHRCSEGARTGKPGQTLGIGGGSVMPRPRSGMSAAQPACTPDTWRPEWTPWTKLGSWSPALRCTEAASRGCLGRPRGVCCTASASAVSMCRRHEPCRRDVPRYCPGRGGRQRQEGNGRSDAARLPARGMLRRVRTALRETVVTTRRDLARRSMRLERGLSGPRSRHAEGRAGKRSEPFPHRDATCPEPRAEQTVEVVGIHEDGTRCAAGGAGTPKGGGNTDREWTHWDHTDEGATRAKPRRGGPGDWSRSRVGALKMAPSPWRTRSVFVNREHQASRAREDPKGHCSDAEGRRGSSEGPASCYCVRPDADPQFERAVCRSRASKGRPTS